MRASTGPMRSATWPSGTNSAAGTEMSMPRLISRPSAVAAVPAPMFAISRIALISISK